MTELMGTLALVGGKPVRTQPYPFHCTTGDEEKEAVLRVLDRGVLSAFEGTNNQNFLGGLEVRSLEEEWGRKFGVKHAVAVNSATSGLLAAVGAAGVGPGDEVIVTPVTMTGTIAAILGCNAVPVFADVEMDTFNLDPSAVERALSPRTKAILVVHLLGHPTDLNPILRMAKRRNILVIEDAAQSPGALYHGKLAGTLGELGVFSLNCNKHIQSGEGGIVVTNDDELAKRVRLIRNHAEAVIATGMRVDSLVNMLGFNLRMTELEAAVARCQLNKLDGLLAQRQELVAYLTRRLQGIPGLKLPTVKPGCTHVYYRYAMLLDRTVVSVSAVDVVRALNAEGLDFYTSFTKPLYLQPMFQQQITYGDRGCPTKCPWYEGRANYAKGICPHAERLADLMISTEIVRPPLTHADIDEIHDGIVKVLEHVDELESSVARQRQ